MEEYSLNSYLTVHWLSQSLTIDDNFWKLRSILVAVAQIPVTVDEEVRWHKNPQPAKSEVQIK